MITKLISLIIGDPNDKEIKRIQKIVESINTIEESYQQLSEEQLKAKTEEFRKRLEQGETLTDILPEAFATVKNACRRLVGQRFQVGTSEKEWVEVPYDVQLIGGYVLHEGRIAEMKTGEGKTLVAALPTYLNALTGKGVHVITVNDYLAKRDSEWMGKLYEYLGLSIGCIIHGLSHQERKAAYNCDITYGTNNEFGFDYLRDNMVQSLDRKVQRDLHYTIVDEVDSILIDEARTPLIISAPSDQSTEKYKQYTHLVQKLQKHDHYEVDEKMKTAILTEDGIRKMEELMGVENIYTEKGFSEVHHIEQALKARAIFRKDIDYVIKDEQIVIVDEFTGRLMPGRRYSNGLHQAIEAKENVEVKRESKTLATITFQNYFRMYEKLAGMTGTAITEAEEFGKIYGLDTLVIPTHRPIARQDLADSIYKTERGKYSAIAKTVKEKHEKGQPCLIGTISIEKSETLSTFLQNEGVPHAVLNAKHHEQEAEIVSKAGEKGAVTIATNMAGRGTDIKLGEGVKEAGGLAILGTERHESRRIDNQLRGRSGRQGDVGESRFYVSLEDSLMRLFGSDRVKKMMDVLNIPEDMPIENGMISKSIEGAQKRVEGHHFDIRKHLVEYDDVMNKHREIIYKKRNNILEWTAKEETGDAIKDEIQSLIKKLVEDIVINHTNNREHADWDCETIMNEIHAIHHAENSPITIEELKTFLSSEEMILFLEKYLKDEYLKKEKSLPENALMRKVELSVYLRTIDVLWMEHIDAMTHLREAVSLRGYAQRNPLLEYKEEAFQLFTKLLYNIERNTINTLFKISINIQAPTLKKPEPIEQKTNEKAITNNLQEPILQKKTAPRMVKMVQPKPQREELKTHEVKKEYLPTAKNKKKKKK